MSIAWIDAALLAALQTQAKNAARLRTHHNFHTDLSDACQRLAVAIEPHSYIAPHRHLAPDKAETLLCLRGRLG
jgi:cupin fold WbuC family metalloprotein